jgi:O-glycosyl hydrolase
VVPNEETEEQSLSTARAILEDKDARAYVGVIGYHTYPHGSPYADIPTILRQSALGRPDRDRVAIRRELRDLGRKYKVPVWMTEVSYGNVDPLSFDAMRGRAVHIHDELVYADASAYFGMNSVVDDVSSRDHWGGGSVPPYEGDVVLIDTKHETVRITGMGYAIGHYARWLKRGAVRVGASTADRLTQVSAFRDDARHRVIIVLINNRNTEAPVDIEAKAAFWSEPVTGEQSASGKYWVSISSVARSSPGTLSLTVPAESVTTLAIPFTVP